MICYTYNAAPPFVQRRDAGPDAISCSRRHVPFVPLHEREVDSVQQLRARRPDCRDVRESQRQALRDEERRNRALILKECRARVARTQARLGLLSLTPQQPPTNHAAA